MKKELYVIFMAMLPVVELRGAIPLGLILGFSLVKSAILGILGNILVVPLLLNIFVPALEFLEKTNFCKKIVIWIKTRTIKKSSRLIEKYSLLGLFLLVAIPVPTTGAWTGSVAAVLLGLGFREALLTIILGILSSGIIVSLIAANAI